MNALVLANKSGDATGKLPPSSCKQDSPTHVTCTGPAPGVSGVVFQTYPSLKALYAAYTAKVTALNSNQFRQNFSDCGSQGTYGEVGWNHLFQHTKAYSVDQMTMGMVKDDQAAGRVFCNYTQGLEYMVWTQNDGRMMGYVAGAGAHERVGLVGRRPPQHRHRRRPHAHVTIGGNGKCGCKSRSLAAVLPGPSSAASRITIGELRYICHGQYYQGSQKVLIGPISHRTGLLAECPEDRG